MADKLGGYMAAWGLHEPRILARTATSDVYTVVHEGVTAVLKILTEAGAEERSGAVALECFAGHGAVRLLRHDEGAHLLEYADGGDLVALVERGEDEAATHIIAGVIAQIHGAPQHCSQEGLFPLDKWFRELFVKAGADEREGVRSIYVRGAEVARRLLADPREVRVLHGDIHHGNIRHAPRGWLAYDPKGLIGERTYDCANTLCNPGPESLVCDESRLMRNAAILAGALDIDLRRLLEFTFAYACLSASWSLSDGHADAARGTLGVAGIVESQLDSIE